MTPAVHLEELPYRTDSCEIFACIRQLPGAAFLDSAHPFAATGRFDILTADPIDPPPPLPDPNADERSAAAFFDELRRYHQEQFSGVQPVAQDIPFCGGLLGCLSYDLGARLQGVDGRALGPLSSLRAYNWCVIQDHLLQRAVLVSLPGLGARRRGELTRMLQQRSPGKDTPFRLQRDFVVDIDEQAYADAFDAIAAYIRAGDCYQVNLARHFQAPCSGDPWLAYRALRGVAAAPFSAYLDLPDGDALLSLSPERFLSLLGHHVETAPVKGTRPRRDNAVDDERAATSLRSSAKDRAENLMIVDLLRNDLGRSCVPGTIHVDKLFEVQSFATVHHLVSTISGELAPGRSAFELLRDSFPGGSITGAPKKRAMQIIDELEHGPRGPYCGSVLYVSADGRMDSNIAIRSLLCSQGVTHCWAGGGIVADSVCAAEYQETLDKVGRFLQVLEALPRD
ncbi:MAG: aminodeoxychorismate synthase component I [Halioglobus sp.]|nr:aminodeoxychorismate synthase component I [Halioglobus sp.]